MHPDVEAEKRRALEGFEVELVGEVIGSFEVAEFVDIMQAARSKK